MFELVKNKFKSSLFRVHYPCGFYLKILQFCLYILLLVSVKNSQSLTIFGPRDGPIIQDEVIFWGGFRHSHVCKFNSCSVNPTLLLASSKYTLFKFTIKRNVRFYLGFSVALATFLVSLNLSGKFAMFPNLKWAHPVVRHHQKCALMTPNPVPKNICDG